MYALLAAICTTTPAGDCAMSPHQTHVGGWVIGVLVVLGIAGFALFDRWNSKDERELSAAHDAELDRHMDSERRRDP